SVFPIPTNYFVKGLQGRLRFPAWPFHRLRGRRRGRWSDSNLCSLSVPVYLASSAKNTLGRPIRGRCNLLAMPSRKSNRLIGALRHLPPHRSRRSRLFVLGFR